jgi:hypothetical protein
LTPCFGWYSVPRSRGRARPSAGGHPVTPASLPSTTRGGERPLTPTLSLGERALGEGRRASSRRRPVGHPRFFCLPRRRWGAMVARVGA